ncbi:MAG: cache domain-containing protein [Desulfobacterales bacterium]
MKLRTKIFVPVTVIILLVGMVSIFFINGNITSMVDRQVEAAEKNMWASLDKNAENEIQRIYREIKKFGQKGTAEATLFTSLPEVIAAYQLALTGNIDDEADPIVQKARQELRDFVKPIMASYRKDTGLPDLMLHFHLKNNRSLTRVWRDGWQTTRDGKKIDVSDDLSSFREMVVAINKGEHKSIHGIEIGRGGFVIRGITPIIAPDGQHMGSNEVFFDFNEILNVIKVNPLVNYAVYMDAKFLSIAKALQDVSKNPVLENTFVFTTSTDSAITEPLINADLLRKGTDAPYSMPLKDHYLTSFPIKDYSGKNVGVMVVAQNIAKQLKAIADTRPLAML